MKAHTGLVPILLILVISSLGSLAALQIIRTYSEYPPDFDEAVHLLPALQIANDVRSLCVADLLNHTYTQDQIAAYPFLNSWLLAPFFLLWKPDIVVARAAGLVYLGASAIVAFGLGRELLPHARLSWLSGLVSGLAVLASMPLWAYASLAYLEAVGLLVTLVGLLCYVKAGADETRPAWLIVASLSAAGALFTKYSFGVFVIGAMVLTEASSVLATRQPPSRKRLLCLAGPCALLILIWFADPNKLYRFLVYSQSQQGQLPFWSADSLLYYPKNLIRYYTAGPLSAMLMLAGLMTSLRAWREHGLRVVLVYLMFSLIALVWVPQKAGRFLYTVAPAALVLAGPPAARVVEWLTKRERQHRLQLAWVVLIGGLLVIEAQAIVRRFSYYEAAIQVNYASSPDTQRAYRFLADHTLAKGIRLHILDGWHLFDSHALEWEYYTAAASPLATFDDRLVTVSLAPEPTDANLNALTLALKQQGVRALVSIDGSPAGSYTGWQVIEPLLAKGELDTHPEHPTYTLFAWQSGYIDRVFAGDFASRDEFELARRANKVEFPIQIHLYFLKP